MHRIYFPNDDFQSCEVTISDGKELHHLKNVLRLQKGELIELFNGEGKEARGEIISLNKDAVKVRISAVKESPHEGPVIVLACSIPKKSKFETIIEKTTELGVDEIIPMVTKRTEVKLISERLEHKLIRYQKITMNASQQCKRATLPRIHPFTGFPEILKRFSKEGTVFIPSLTGKRERILEAMQQHPQARGVVFLIGPEGDFTPEEYSLAKRAGAIPLSLGKNILRVETAAISVVAAARFFYF